MKNVEYITDEDGLLVAMQYLNQLKIVGYDIETNGLDPLVNDILLIQLGDSDRQCVFNVYELGDKISPVINYINKKDVTKIAHNAKFEYSFTKAKYGLNVENWVCTQVCNELLIKGLYNVKSDLESCLDKYIGFREADKRQQKSFIGMQPGDEFTPEQIAYAGEDVEYLHELWYKQKKLLDERGMSELADLENETIRSCGDLELNGIYVDREKWVALRDDAFAKAQKAKAELDVHFTPILPVDLFGEPVINYNSPAQLKKALEIVLKRKLESTNENYLKSFEHEVIETLFDYREAAKLVSTYGHKFLNDNVHPVTGRLHARFLQMRADTGRMASAGPKTCWVLY